MATRNHLSMMVEKCYEIRKMIIFKVLQKISQNKKTKNKYSEKNRKIRQRKI